MSSAARHRRERVRRFMRDRAPQGRRTSEGWTWNNVHMLSDEAWWIRQPGAGRWRQERLAFLKLAEEDLPGLPADQRAEIEWMITPPHPDESQEVDLYWHDGRDVYFVRMYIRTEAAISAYTGSYGKGAYVLDIHVSLPGERISSAAVLRVLRILRRYGLPGRRSLKRRPKRYARVAWNWAPHRRALAAGPDGEVIP